MNMNMNYSDMMDRIRTSNKSEIVNKIHSLIVMYFLLGWIIESQRKYLVFILPSLQFQFLVNNNECLLTQLETKLLKDEKKDDDKELKKESFVDNKLKKESFVDKKLKQFGINLDPKIREYMIHGSLYASFTISYFFM